MSGYVRLLDAFKAPKLSDKQAFDAAARLKATGLWKVDVFRIGFGSSVVELRALPGPGQIPPVILRTQAEVEEALLSAQPPRGK